MGTKSCRLGMIVPSSNTVVEPVTAALASQIPDLNVHFTRLRVQRIALDDDSNEQFAEDAFCQAAGLLGDARVNVVAWNGTSGSWRGSLYEDRLCTTISGVAGVPATTSTKAILSAFASCGVRRPGLLTPYTNDVGAQIARTYAAAGFPVHAGLHLGLSTNFDFAVVPSERLSQTFESLVEAGCDGVAVVCTNLATAAMVEEWEQTYGTLVVDSVIATFWESVSAIGRRVSIPGFGRLLSGYSSRAHHLN